MARTDDRAREHLRSIEALAEEIAARLRRVCPYMPDDEFNAMVADIASMRARFAEIEARYMHHDRVDRTCEERLTTA